MFSAAEKLERVLERAPLRITTVVLRFGAVPFVDVTVMRRLTVRRAQSFGRIAAIGRRVGAGGWTECAHQYARGLKTTRPLKAVGAPPDATLPIAVAAPADGR